MLIGLRSSPRCGGTARFLISPIAARAGATTAGMIYACLAGITAATAVAWLSPAAVACVVLGLLGFFLGPVFPTTMAIVPRLTRQRLVPTGIGVMNGGAVIGGAALPWRRRLSSRRAETGADMATNRASSTEPHPPSLRTAPPR